MEFLNLAASGELAFALQDGFNVLFTVHTNVIVVTIIRISNGDLIAVGGGVGAATKTFAPGGKHPRAATGGS